MLRKQRRGPLIQQKRVWFISQMLIICMLMSSASAFAQAPPEPEVHREVNLEWEPVSDASAYELQVTRILASGEKKEPFVVKLTDSRWQAKIAPGQYEMQLRSLDARGVPGEWSPPSEFWVKVPSPKLNSPAHRSVIKSDQLDEAEVTFKWTLVNGAENYRLEIRSFDGAVKETFTATEISKEVELPVAKTYRWKVTSVMPEGVDGETATKEYVFRLMGGQLEKPTIDRPVSTVVEQLEWHHPDKTQFYRYKLFQQSKNNKWKVIEGNKSYTKSELPFDLARPSGRYKLAVKAYAKGHVPSPTATQEFDVHGGLRTPAAIAEAKLVESLKKPTNFYAIASYFITQMNYASVDHESNTRPSLNAIGGTGRLGAGYDAPNLPWGSFVIVDLSGFNIASENFTFASAELHGTWRLNLGTRGQSLVGAGVYYKELPHLRGNSQDGFSGVGKVKAVGPHFGFKYWFPINYKLGVQVNGRGYYSLLGTGSNGRDIQPSLSMQFGLLGSYRLTSSIMGYAGYAYRKDQALYDATAFDGSNDSLAATGDVNTIQIEGHYLNLILEYSF